MAGITTGHAIHVQANDIHLYIQEKSGIVYAETRDEAINNEGQFFHFSEDGEKGIELSPGISACRNCCVGVKDSKVFFLFRNFQKDFKIVPLKFEKEKEPNFKAASGDFASFLFVMPADGIPVDPEEEEDSKPAASSSSSDDDEEEDSKPAAS